MPVTNKKGHIRSYRTKPIQEKTPINTKQEHYKAMQHDLFIANKTIRRQDIENIKLKDKVKRYQLQVRLLQKQVTRAEKEIETYNNTKEIKES
jgi:predicted  nucleic acid-binding Zn-ribbon protein